MKPSKADGRLGLDSRFNLSASSGVVWGFIHADVEQTSNTLRKELKAKRWVKNVCGKTLKSAGDYFVPFRIAGNEWTNLVDFLKIGNTHLSPELLQTVSQRLKTRTIFSVYERTSGVFLYELYDKGKVIERLHWDGSAKSRVVPSAGMANEGFSFYSKLRKISARSLTYETLVRFFDSLLKSQGVFLILETGTDDEGKFTFEPEELERSDIERADYIGLLREGEIQAERISQKPQGIFAETVYDCVGAYFWAFKAREEYKNDKSVRFTDAGDASWRRCHQRKLRKIKKLLLDDFDFDPEGRWLSVAARKGDEQLATLMLDSGYYDSRPEFLEEAAAIARENEHQAIATRITLLIGK